MEAVMRIAIAALALVLAGGVAVADPLGGERTGRSNDAGAGQSGDGSSRDDPTTTPGVDYTGWCCRYNPSEDLDGDGVMSQAEAAAAEAKFGGDWSDDVGKSPYW
jgi:hypothetical protein